MQIIIEIFCYRKSLAQETIDLQNKQIHDENEKIGRRS